MMDSMPERRDPVVRRIGVADVAEAFGQGLRDFQAAPLYGLMFGGLFAAGGMLIVLSVIALGVGYLAYPLAAGFALIGPFVAAGLYQISRRLEAGQTPSLRDLWAAMTQRSELGWMAFVTVFIFILWMYQVRLLMALLLGINVRFSSAQDFIGTLLTTNEGLLFLAIGHLDGAVLALIVFSLTVVSFPLLLERDLDCVTAMITSVRAVATNPGPMIGWAAVVVVLLIISATPFFLGLIVTLPVLGHTTWHLYRRVVAPEGEPAAPVAAPAAGL